MVKIRHPDEVWRQIIVIMLIIFAINGLFFMAKFVGNAVSDETLAGTINEIEIGYKEPATTWAGVYGVAVLVSEYNGSQSSLIQGNTITDKNLLFQCLEPGINHEVYASTALETDIEWSTLRIATPAEIDLYLGFTGTEMMSAAKTFLRNSTIDVGTQTFSNIPTAYTYEYNNQDPTTTNKFNTAIFIDDLDNLVFATTIQGFVKGFNDKLINYQMLLPIPNQTIQTYNFFTDPNDECPAGIGTAGGYGNITGNVTSNQGGTLLNGVIVMLEGANFTTVANGNYTMSVPDGIHNIVAIRDNHKTYYGVVNITAGNTTIHNIVMEVETADTGTGVGPGIGPGVSDGVGPGVSDGVGPGESDGIGPGVGPFIEKPELQGQEFVISIPKINKRLKIGNYLEDTIQLISFKEGQTQLKFIIEGNISQILKLGKDLIILNSKESADLNYTILASRLGIYEGNISIEGSLNEKIPVKIVIGEKDLLNVQALDLNLETIDKIVHPGDLFRFRTILRNLISDQGFPVSLVFTIEELDGNKTIWATTENVGLQTTITLLKQVRLEKTLPPGDYIIKVRANYLEFSSIVSDVIKVRLIFYNYMVLGKFPLWYIFVALGIILLLTLIAWLIYRNIESKKKFHIKVEYGELPKPGPRNAYVGKIAETDHKAYFNLENFKVHTIVAGSTGGGKSFSAQGIIEEMLLKDVAIIVFDPTAQWTGFLRKMKAKPLLDLYPMYGMKKSDAKAFNGNIRMINDARELIDIKKYMKPGEIQIFCCHKLDPKDMDVYVANAIKEVFHAGFDESPELRLMLVFDEIHRILPKFGGSGAGFLQIERGCREFRKWGLGIMLISQVLGDFMGEIKANINTEIQMRTRDEGDLDRIATKYGKEILQSLVKATVGSGMVENPAYNRGRPYFVAFKPLRHSVERLSDEDIEKYNQYNEMIDQLEYELKQLEEEHGQDVFDLKLELKLSLDKVKSGNFNMVDIYVDGLKPRIQKLWDKVGATPKKFEIKLVSEAELAAELEKAKAEKAKADKESKKNAPAQSDANGEAEKPKDKTTLDLKTDFQSAFTFANGQQVTSLAELMDVLPAIGGPEFAKSVSAEKNDLADWIKTTFGAPEFAEKIRPIIDHDELMAAVDHEMKNPTKIKDIPKPAAPQTPEPTPVAPVGTPEPAGTPEPSPTPIQTAQPPLAATPAKTEAPTVQVPNVTSSTQTQTQTIPVKPAQKEKVESQVVQAGADEGGSVEQIQNPQSQNQEVNWPQVKQEYQKMGSIEDKIHYLEEEQKLLPNEPNLKFALALEYHKKKDYDNAEKLYIETLKQLPNNVKILVYLGTVQEILNKKEDSINSFRKVLELDANNDVAKKHLQALSAA